MSGRGLGAWGGAAVGLCAGTLVGGLEAAWLASSAGLSALVLVGPAVVLDGALGMILGALVGVLVPLALSTATAARLSGLGVIAVVGGLGVSWQEARRDVRPALPRTAVPELSEPGSLLVVVARGGGAADLDAMPALAKLVEEGVSWTHALPPHVQPREALRGTMSLRFPSVLPQEPAADLGAIGHAMGLSTGAVVQTDSPRVSAAALVRLAPEQALGAHPDVASLALWPGVEALAPVEGPQGEIATMDRVIEHALGLLVPGAPAPFLVVVDLADVPVAADRAAALSAVDAGLARLVQAARVVDHEAGVLVLGTGSPDRPLDWLGVARLPGGALAGERQGYRPVSVLDVVHTTLREVGLGDHRASDGRWLGGEFRRLRRRDDADVVRIASEVPVADGPPPPEACGRVYDLEIVDVVVAEGDPTVVRSGPFDLEVRDGTPQHLYDRIRDPARAVDLLQRDVPGCPKMPHAERATAMAGQAGTVLREAADTPTSAPLDVRWTGGLRQYWPEVPEVSW